MVAERAGFEPAVPRCGTTAFEAAAFNHSATSPHYVPKMITEERKGGPAPVVYLRATHALGMHKGPSR